MATHRIIAYPLGARSVRAILPRSCRDEAIARAVVHARLIGDYVDVEASGHATASGFKCIAVCDGAGSAHGYGEFRSYPETEPYCAWCTDGVDSPPYCGNPGCAR